MHDSTQRIAAALSPLAIAALTLLLSLCTPLRADDKPDDALKANELSRIGAVYVLPIEATLPESLRALRIAQKPIDDHASVRTEIEKTKAANDKLIAAIDAELLRLAERSSKVKDPTAQAALAKQEQALRTKRAEAVASNEHGDKQLSTLDDATDYLAQLLPLSDQMEAAAKTYAVLAANDEVKHALSTLNQTARPRYRLGPSETFTNELTRVRKQMERVETLSLRLREVGDSFQLPVTLNTVLTEPMVVDADAPIMLVGADMVKALELTPAGNNRKFQATIAGTPVTMPVMVIRNVRFGPVSVNDVECAVLPDTMRELPCVLGGAFFKKLVYHLDPEARELHIYQWKLKPTAPSREVATTTKAPATRPATSPTTSPTASPLPDAVLTQHLNDFDQWTLARGRWEWFHDHLRGVGENLAQFNDPLPANCTISFRMNIVLGIHPHVAFQGTGISLLNVAALHRVRIRGSSELQGTPFTFKDGEEHLYTFKFLNDRFSLDIDGKPTFAGSREVPPSIRLELQSGDNVNRSITEFWDFKVEPPPAALSTLPDTQPPQPPDPPTPPGPSVKMATLPPEFLGPLQPATTGPASTAPASTAAAVSILPPGKILLICTNEEQEVAVEACSARDIILDVAESFDAAKDDYSEYAAILAGSNSMDYWAKEDRKAPAAFRHINRFIENGGHLIVFGSFNGRNCDHLQDYGLYTGAQHSDFVGPYPGGTEFLMAGIESLFPANRRMHCAGNVRSASPHVVLIRRLTKMGLPDGPAMVTLPWKKGRITYSAVEPHWKQPFDALWLITATVDWYSRGSPIGPLQPGLMRIGQKEQEDGSAVAAPPPRAAINAEPTSKPAGAPPVAASQPATRPRGSGLFSDPDKP